MKKLSLFAALLALSLTAQATPTAWGQPMPEQCTTRFEWKSPNSYPVHVYDAPGCLQPWLENAVTFWNWFKEKANGSNK